MITPEKLDEIRAAAEKATKGKRATTKGDVFVSLSVGNDNLIAIFYRENQEANAKLAALTDPDTIIAMIARIRELESEAQLVSPDQNKMQALQAYVAAIKLTDKGKLQQCVDELMPENKLLREGLEKIGKGEVPTNAVSGLRFIANNTLDNAKALKQKGNSNE